MTAPAIPPSAPYIPGPKFFPGLSLTPGNNQGALVTTPTLSLASAAPASTPTKITASNSGALNTANFSFKSGAWVCPCKTQYPYYTQATRQQAPNSTLGYGRAYVEFYSDAPIATFVHSQTSGASTRIIVDGNEIFRIVQGVHAGTAQGGSSSTITLDSGASSTNGQYFNNWVHITSGTGAGQYAQISAYAGSTKVATISPNWTTAPDNTSTFEITDSKALWSNLTQTGWATYYATATWGGERRMRHYRVETSGWCFAGVYVTSAIDTVMPCQEANNPPLIVAGDSFAAGTGSDMGDIGSFSRVIADQLGCELINLSVGGTGLLNSGGNSYTLPQRLLPPVNSWFIASNGGSGSGNWSLTQNSVTTAGIAWGASQSTIQAACDAAFGAGNFSVIAGGAGDQQNIWLVGNGSNASFAGAMTLNSSGVTGSLDPMTITRWAGDLALHMPYDGNGNALPFILVLAVGHNDTTSSNPAYTPAAVTAAYASLIQGLVAKYPNMMLFVVGNMYLPGGSVPAAVTACNAAIFAACQAALPKINGQLPFIDTITNSWFSGTGYVGALAGNGDSDVCCFTDGIHPSTAGQIGFGVRIANLIGGLLRQ